LAEGKTPLRNVVKISIEVYGAHHESSVAAFNQRMREGHAPTDFLLGPHSIAPRVCGGVTATQWVAVDDAGQVRGGVISWDHPGIVGGKEQRIINLQSPLSEGIIDSAYILVGSQIVKFFLRETPYVYIVGMGAEDRPLPRVLKAMGWTVRPVPFFFHMIHPARCVRELGPLRNSVWKRLAGTAAASTGMASVAAMALHRAAAPVRRVAAAYSAEEVTSWGAWAAEAWSALAPSISFGVRRDPETLSFYYPFTDKELRVWKLRHGTAVDGWFAMAISKMSGNAYFGNLRVATLTDCLGTPDAIRSGSLLAIEQAGRLGADLLITNQAYGTLQQACLDAGWRRGPSNFLLGTSKALSNESEPDSAYVTRRDGDGLVNLLPSA
jgi:hypothetical protein